MSSSWKDYLAGTWNILVKFVCHGKRTKSTKISDKYQGRGVDWSKTGSGGRSEWCWCRCTILASVIRQDNLVNIIPDLGRCTPNWLRWTVRPGMYFQVGKLIKRLFVP